LKFDVAVSRESVLKIVLNVIHDERTVTKVVELLQRVMDRPATKDALVVVLSNAMQDGLGKEASIDYVRAVVTAETVSTQDLSSIPALDCSKYTIRLLRQ